MSQNDFYCENIFSGKTTFEKYAETPLTLAFAHTNPSWSFHAVIVPKEHIVALTDVQHFNSVEDIFKVIQRLIKEKSLESYKVITNGGSFQDSKHLHFHLVSGFQIK